MELTVEEKRLPPESAGNAFDTFISDFSRDWSRATSLSDSQKMVNEYSIRLWNDAKSRIRTRNDFDDRPLYWARLAITSLIRSSKSGFSINDSDRKNLVAIFEKGSRGMVNITFPEDRNILKVLISGFDPFNLIGSRDSCNIAGANALLLDGTELTIDKSRTAHVRGAIFPVRYEDFDAGIVESFFSPWISSVGEKFGADIIITTSLGRSDFDLERFPARCRFSGFPDNLSVSIYGLNEFPKLNGTDIVGPSFVEFSLPVQAFLVEQSPYKVNDNRAVAFLSDDGERIERISATSLGEIVGKHPTEGSPGNYLSNEITYRTLLLRDNLKSKMLPMGHIHLPKSNDAHLASNLDPENAEKIVKQFRTMLTRAIATL